MKKVLLSAFALCLINVATYAGNQEKAIECFSSITKTFTPCWGLVEVYNEKKELVVTEMFMSATATNKDDCSTEFRAFAKGLQATYPSDYAFAASAYWTE